MIRAVALASGSNGNSVWVETPDVRLLFDAGLSGRRLADRAAGRGVDLDRLDGLFLTHDHSDHVAGAGVVHRRHDVPLFATKGTWAEVRARLGSPRARTFPAGETLEFGSTRILTVPTPHDGREGVAYVVEHGGLRVGILTDLGHVFPELLDVTATLDGAFLEANYDPRMLETGPYPERLKERIAGPRGHLSNPEAVELARDAGGERLRWLVLGHLSGENNDPAAVLAAAGPLARRGLDVRLAPRTASSDLMVLDDPA